MLHEDRLTQPLRWSRPRRIFVNSLSDLFHRDVPDEFIERVLDVMVNASWHTFQVLTKRPERMRRFFAKRVVPDNVWLGVSIESMDYAWRVNMLCETPALWRWISAEPLLGSLRELNLDGVDWVVVGGESGPGARDMKPRWARELRDKCVESAIPFLFKQWGAFNESGHLVGKHAAGRMFEGRTWDEYPATAAGLLMKGQER